MRRPEADQQTDVIGIDLLLEQMMVVAGANLADEVRQILCPIRSPEQLLTMIRPKADVIVQPVAQDKLVKGSTRKEARIRQAVIQGKMPSCGIRICGLVAIVGWTEASADCRLREPPMEIGGWFIPTYKERRNARLPHCRRPCEAAR